jgi:hypothetical protein
MEDLEEEPWLKVGVAAALARAYAADQRAFLEALAGMMENAMPAHTRVARGGGLFVRNRPVREVAVELADLRYVLADTGKHALSAQRILRKRGIVLKTETLSVEDWIEALVAALQEHAQQSREAAEALRRFTT